MRSIPVPWDSRKTNFWVIVNEPNVAINIERCKSTLSSLFRDETKTVDDIVKILTDHSYWAGKVSLSM